MALATETRQKVVWEELPAMMPHLHTQGAHMLLGDWCSIAWAYSRNRSRRYMDLKEADNRMTEMAAQQRRDAHV